MHGQDDLLRCEKHLHHLINEFVAHYHLERPHQGLGNRRIIESGQDHSRPGTRLVPRAFGRIAQDLLPKSGVITDETKYVGPRASWYLFGELQALRHKDPITLFHR